MKFTIKLKEIVYHEATVEANTRAEARVIARQKLADDDLDFYEVDSEGLKIVNAFLHLSEEE